MTDRAPDTAGIEIADESDGHDIEFTDCLTKVVMPVLGIALIAIGLIRAI